MTVAYGDRLGLEEDSDGDNEQELDDEENQSETLAGSVHINIPTGTVISPSTIGHNHHLAELEQAQMRPRPSLPLRHNTTHLDDMANYGDQHAFYAPRNVPYPSQSPVEMSRRNFASPAYTTSQQPMFSWSNSMPAPSQTANYYSPPQQAGYTPMLPLPPLNTQPMNPSTLHASYDGIPRYDIGPAAPHQLRTGSVGHTSQMHHAYPDYMQGSFQGHQEMKEEPQHSHLQ